MPSEPEKSASPSLPSSGRLWAEQLAAGLALLVGLLIFLALFQAHHLEEGAKVLGPNYISAYGWYSLVGIILHLLIHEAGTWVVAWRMKVPLRFRFFPFGANATAILQDRPREVGLDAVVGLAGPVTGTLLSLLSALIYYLTENPFFLGMACVGYFYNLFTLIPILDLEGGWIAPAIAPQAWLLGLFGVGVTLAQAARFNIVLLCVFCFALPRFVLLLRARMPRTDLACTIIQRVVVSIGFFVLVIGLAWMGTSAFDALAAAVPEAMGD